MQERYSNRLLKIGGELAQCSDRKSERGLKLLELKVGTTVLGLSLNIIMNLKYYDSSLIFHMKLTIVIGDNIFGNKKKLNK